jgi:hypothetical protein
MEFRKKNSNVWQDFVGGMIKRSLRRGFRKTPLKLIKRARVIVEAMCCTWHGVVGLGIA